MFTRPAVIPTWLLAAPVEPRAVMLFAQMSTTSLERFDAEVFAERMRITSVSVYRYLQALIEAGAVRKNGPRDYELVYEAPAASEAVA